MSHPYSLRLTLAVNLWPVPNYSLALFNNNDTDEYVADEN